MTEAPEPILTIALEASLAADRGRLAIALERLTAEDRSLRVSIDHPSGQIIVGGASELHLDEAIDRLRWEHEIDVNVGAPQVAYRETLTRRVETDYTHKTQTGGTGQFARVKFVFEPNEPGVGALFVSNIAGGAMPEDYIAAIEKGVDSVRRAGVLAGFPVVDVKATLIDGAFHDVDSSVMAFEIASRAAFCEALSKGASVLLEPVMKVEVTTPEDYTGFVTGDLIARRGQVKDQDTRGRDASEKAVVIIALVPLANMFGYVSQLRSGTHGRATFTMSFAGYRPVDAPAPPTPPRFPPAAALRVA